MKDVKENPFKERLDIFKEAGMIDEDDISFIDQVVLMFKETYDIELTEENAGAFIAHLVMVLSRNKTKEDVAPIEDSVLEELKALDTYSLSLEMLNKINLIANKDFGEIENNYILLHINTLLNR